MPSIRRTLLSIAGSALLLTITAQAHHSFAMFDRGKTLTIDGTVHAFSWANPHPFVWIDVANDHGGADLWAIEFASGPVLLARRGWRKETLKPGDRLRVELNPLRDGRSGGVLKRAFLADGTVLDEEIDLPATDGNRSSAP